MKTEPKEPHETCGKVMVGTSSHEVLGRHSRSSPVSGSLHGKMRSVRNNWVTRVLHRLMSSPYIECVCDQSSGFIRASFYSPAASHGELQRIGHSTTARWLLVLVGFCLPGFIGVLTKVFLFRNIVDAPAVSK